MPIGASKVGALGGLVPGGSVTFNTTDTWVVPPGVKIVSITGKGGTGNPGVAGNAGNPGNPGNGGGGGAARNSSIRGNPSPTAPQSEGNRGGIGGSAWKFGASCFLYLPSPAQPSRQSGSLPAPLAPYVALGGYWSTPCVNVDAPIIAAQAGSSGNAGNVGQAGTAGNAGQPSSALCNTFPGGAGGNAPPGGAAGNAGTGGQGGGEGGRNGPGAAGNSGGAGGSGANLTGPFLPVAPSPVNAQNYFIGAGGGGGAGVTNSGSSGTNVLRSTPGGLPGPAYIFYARGGTTSGLNAPNPNVSPISARDSNFQSPRPPTTFCVSSTGGQGGAGIEAFGNQPAPSGTNSINVTGGGDLGWNVSLSLPSPPTGYSPSRGFVPNYNPACIRPSIFRSGGGGGAAGLIAKSCMSGMNIVQVGGGGGGGGRGNAGNAGQNSPTVSGSAATPLTFNCVPVTPGAPYPITVGGPSGGQIVISWNPQ